MTEPRCLQVVWDGVDCDEPSEPWSDYCAYHSEPDLWDKADEAYDFYIADRLAD